MQTSVDAEIGCITELALASPNQLAFREALLERLDRLVGFDLGKIQSSPDGMRTFVICSRGWKVDEIRAHTVRYLTEFEPLELSAIGCGRPVVDHDFVTSGRRDRLALYREQMQPHGVTAVTTMGWQDERGRFGCTLARTGRGAAFSPSELDTLERLLPSIKLAEAYLGILTTPRETGEMQVGAWAKLIGLSERERAVTELVVRGLRNREIAGVLSISPVTVRNHLASIFRKAEVTTRAELAFLCAQGES